MSWLAPLYIDPPRGPDGKVQGPPPITWRLALGLLGAVLGSFISNLDTRLTTFSLADLRGGIGYGVDEAAWVSSAYNIAEIAVVPMTPWLAGIISQRRAVAGSVILLTLAGALCPWAATQGYVWLVAMRFLQGLGGGALIPLLLGILLRHTPLHQRIYGFTFYALVTASTPLISESLAGVLTDIVHWQSVFYVGGVIGPIVLGLVMFGLPVDPMKPEVFRSTDYAGMFLMVLVASLLTAALDEGQRLDWFSSSFIVSLFGGAAVVLVAFVTVELCVKAPLINLRLLLRRNFTGGLLTIFAFAVSTLGTSLLLPQYGIQVRGFRELQVGNILIWAALAQLFACALTPFLLRVLEARIVLALGLLTVAMGARLATFADSDWVRADILPSHILQACGQPLIMVSLVVIATSTLQMSDALPGATLFNVIRTLAGSVGGAVLGGILAVRERVHSNTIVDHLITGSASVADAPSLGALACAVRRQATTMAIADAFGWLGIIMLGAILIALALHETKLFRAPTAQKTQKFFGSFFQKRTFFLCLFLLMPASAIAAEGPFETALAQAYLYNPQLLVARKQLREADENVPKALSGWRPHVTIDGSFGVSSVFDSMDPTHQPERRVPQESVLSVTQPLYTGGRVHAQVAQADALVAAERAALQATEAAVLLAAGTAYLDVARDQRVVDLDHNEETVLERTLHASEQELAAGAVTETDVAQARARLADQRARAAQALASLGVSRAAYERQIGQPPGASPLPDRPLNVPSALDAALTHVSDNFDVAQSRAAQEAARQGVDIARAGLQPRLSAEFHAGRIKETDVQFPHQRDDLAEATLQLTIPIYQGGEQAAEIRQAKEASARSLLQVDVVLRQARAEIEAAWADLDGARTRIAEYRVSLAANAVAARGVARQQSVGARTLLEVLNAQQEQLSADVNLVTAERDSLVASLQLQAAIGELSAARLGLDVPLYDPVAHYNATRGRWYGTGPAP